ncbi:MAG: ABC transporter substrate-binding protein [Bdellovibrionota bacterium]
MKLNFKKILLYGGGIFVIHLQNEPASLDPHRLRLTNFVTQNLYRNLYRYDNQMNLVPDLAESCTTDFKNKSAKTFQTPKVTCTLRKNLKWSDGSPLNAESVLQSYQRFLASTSKSPRADILFPVVNAEKYFKGEVDWKNVGIQIGKNESITFTLNRPDPDFIHRLASPFNVPVKDLNSGKLLSSGPFQLEVWKPEESILLNRNKNDYVTGSSTDATVQKVQFKVVDESVLALRMYEKGKIDFLPLLPTLFIPRWKSRADFSRVTLLRFDYLGFGPQLKDHKTVRETLAAGIDYDGFQKILFADGKPGCLGTPDAWAPGVCIPNSIKNRQFQKPLPEMPKFLEYVYSQYAIEDLKRSAEWIQHSWKKNLGWNVKLRGMENRVLLSTLKTNPPPIFRRALTPERPTCLSVLEVFTSNHPDNLIQLKSVELDSWVQQMGLIETTEQDRSELCRRGLSFLVEERYIVPLGPMSFAVLLNPDFENADLNSLYQLDLTNLKRKSR